MTSICCAHPIVIEASLRHALKHDDALVLFEATCNQVNQDGGYTGMTPADFVELRARHRAAASASMRRASFWAVTTSARIPGPASPPMPPWPRPK